MIIILSPSKKQKLSQVETSTPLLFNQKKEHLVDIIQQFTLEEIKERFKTSDNLSQKTYDAYQNYHENSLVYKTYTGDAFKTLDLPSLEEKSIQKHVRILSALYGVLEPLNQISLYRLDFLTKLDFNLYDFWKTPITDYFNQLNRPIINLASKEFSSMLDKDNLKVPIYHFEFLNTKSIKQTRGLFARTILENKNFKLDTLEVEDYRFVFKSGNVYTYEFIK